MHRYHWQWVCCGNAFIYVLFAMLIEHETGRQCLEHYGGFCVNQSTTTPGSHCFPLGFTFHWKALHTEINNNKNKKTKQSQVKMIGKSCVESSVVEVLTRFLTDLACRCARQLSTCWWCPKQKRAEKLSQGSFAIFYFT